MAEVGDTTKKYVTWTKQVVYKNLMAFPLVLLLLLLMVGCSDGVPASSVAVSTSTPVTATYLANAQRTGVYTNTTAPTLSSTVWTYSIAHIKSPLIVSDNAVYFTTETILHELDLFTGNVLWETPAYQTPPLVSGANIYYFGPPYTLYALDRKTRQEKWKFDVEANLPEKWKYDSLGYMNVYLVASDSTLYVATDTAYIFAFDLETGRQKWQMSVGDRMDSPPALDETGTTLYVTSSKLVLLAPDNMNYEDGTLHALDAHLGKQKWSFPTAGILQGPTVAAGIVYVIEPTTFNDIVHALDQQSGKELWQYTTEVHVDAPLTVGSDLLYEALNTVMNTVRMDVIDLNGRIVRWHYISTYKIYGTSIAGDTLYISSSDGNLYALDKETGQQKGKFTASGGIYYPPVISNGIAYFADAYTVYAVR